MCSSYILISHVENIYCTFITAKKSSYIKWNSIQIDFIIKKIPLRFKYLCFICVHDYSEFGNDYNSRLHFLDENSTTMIESSSKYTLQHYINSCASFRRFLCVEQASSRALSKIPAEIRVLSLFKYLSACALRPRLCFIVFQSKVSSYARLCKFQ